MRKTIGLLGGSFNPIHDGHLAMARAARLELGLDRIILMPDGDPPHKAKGLVDKRDRLQMVSLAAEDAFEVSAMEVERPGKTYTVDTLEALRAERPDADIVMIIGADTLREISGWRNAPRVFTLCRFAVAPREGVAYADVPGADVMFLKTAPPPISATAIRARVHRGLSIEGLTPQAVADYIGACRLYNPPVRMRRKEIRKRLKGDLSASRMRHVLGAEKTIMALAERWGYDVKRAGLAGLLHDCAKGMSLSAMRELVDRHGLFVDDVRYGGRELLHASAGAAMAQMVYGVTDPEVLSAIRYHNTGYARMGTLDKLLYLADTAEPNRRQNEWLDGLRRLAFVDLDEAVRECMRRRLGYIEEAHHGVHPDTAAAYAALGGTTKRREPNGAKTEGNGDPHRADVAR